MARTPVHPPPPTPEAAMLAGVQLLARTGGVVEARVLNTKKGTASGYFDNYERLAQAVLPFYQQQSIYITLNPAHPDLLHRAANRLREWVKRDGDTTKDIEVARRIWFPIDLDPTRPTGIGSTRAELNRALAKQLSVVAYLHGLGFPTPVQIMSGNGAHLLYACDLPNDEPTAQLFRHALEAVKAQFEDAEVLVDTSVYSAGQIWKLPGSYAVKGDPSPERPHRVATVLECPATLELVSVACLTALAAEAPADSEPTPAGSRGGGLPPLKVLEAVKARGWYLHPLGGNKHAMLCPWRVAHSMESGDSETALFEPTAHVARWGFKCQHAHCTQRTIRDLLDELGLLRDTDSTPSMTDAHPQERRTDMGNVRRLMAAAGGDFRYHHSTGWLSWDGWRWGPDGTSAIMRAAKTVAEALWDELAALDPSQKRERAGLRKWARLSEMTARLHGMVKLAESEAAVIVTPDQLDQDRWLLNLLNPDLGTYNLTTDTLQPHRREDYITKLARVTYDPTARASKWESFLELIFPEQPDLIAFLQRWAGYCLTGDAGERVVLIAYGSGANGKTTFFETLRGLLGDYARATPMSTLMVKRGEQIPNDVARLRGARLVTASEGEAGQRLAESTIKAMVGGDVLMARYLNKEWFEFTPEFKVALLTNHKPVIRGVENAIWDRLRLVPFTVTIPLEARIGRYHELLLREEAAGILNWALAGCRAWRTRGLGTVAVIEEATQAYRAEQDRLAEFLAVACVQGGGTRTLFSDLYIAYVEWTQLAHEPPMSTTAFGRHLGDRGFVLKQVKGVRYREGLTLTTVWQEVVERKRVEHRAGQAREQSGPQTRWRQRREGDDAEFE